MDILPTTKTDPLNLAHEGGRVPELLSDLKIEGAAKNILRKFGRHYEMTKLLNLRRDDDFCASLGMWKPLKLETLKKKLETYYSEVCPDLEDVQSVVEEAVKLGFHSQQLLHYHLQNTHGVSLFEHMPPPIIAHHVHTEATKDGEDMISAEFQSKRLELRPTWNHITDTYGYSLSGKTLPNSRHEKQNKDKDKDIKSSPGHPDPTHRRSIFSFGNSHALKKKTSSGSDFSNALNGVSRQSLTSMGSEKSLTSSPGIIRHKRSHGSSSGSMSFTSIEDLIQYEIMIRGSHWTWSGGLPFPNDKTCKFKSCKHCKLHKTMIAENYKCYVRISKLSDSPQAETNARAHPQRLEHTTEEKLCSNPSFPASILLELSTYDVHNSMLRFEVCLRNTEGRSHFVMARMEIRASSLLCRPMGSEITMMCRSGTWCSRVTFSVI